MSVRHFIDLWKLEPAAVRLLLDDARDRKAARKGWPRSVTGKGWKPNARRAALPKTVQPVPMIHLPTG